MAPPRIDIITFEGKAKSSRVKAVMKWWSKCISMVIAKTASRNVAFKSDKIIDALFQGQSVAQTPQQFFDADFEGLASNAEVYIFNQDDSQEQAWAYFGYVSAYTVYVVQSHQRKLYSYLYINSKQEQS